ncbi:MAG: tetratricopeptide repeat protein [Verrucomicrobia bacterium]|nr:tetratricopeptide repeat protein [Verrucomicrobiota bacterium]
MRIGFPTGVLVAALLAAWPAYAITLADDNGGSDDAIAQLEAERVREIMHAIELLRYNDDDAGALAMYRKGLALRPKDAELLQAFTNLGDWLAARGVTRKIDAGVVTAFLDDYEAWLGDDNAYPSKFWWLRSVLLRRDGRTAEADQFAEQALAYKAEDSAYHWAIAYYLISNRLNEEAIREYEHGLPFADGDWSRGNYTLGLAAAHIDLERYEQGVEYYEKAIALLGLPAPNNTLNRIYADAAAACLSLGRSYELLGEHTKTVEANERALKFQPAELDDEMRPNFGAVQHAIGEAYLKLEQPQKALEYLERAVKMMPEAPGFSSTLGDAYAALDDKVKAREAYDKCVELYNAWIKRRPTSGSPCNGLAWHYATHDEHLDEALELSKRSLELAPDVPEYLDTLAEIYYRQGDYDSAIEWIRKALDLDPKPKHLLYYEQQLAKFEKATRRD